MKLKPLVMQVRPHLLYKPDLISGSSPPDPSANHNLLDRVVNVRQGFSVPLGARGTVIGIKNAAKVLDVVYEVLFDQEFPGALPVRGVPDSPNRVYHLPAWSIINLSYGKRQQVERERQGKPTAVVRPSGSGLNKQANQAEGSSDQPRQTYSSYKASLEHRPSQGKQAQQIPVQPKILSKKKTENPQSAASGPVDNSTTTSRHPTKSAPSPSSLPSPFMDIWNSLFQQHEQQQQQKGATPIKGTREAAKPEQQQRSQSKKVEPPVPVAPRLPSLQEAARSLPKLTNVPKAPAKAPPSQAAADQNQTVQAPHLPNPVFQAIPPPLIPTVASIPVGPSLSVQQLFDMASQAALPNPIVPQQPPPVFSFCLQLMDIAQQIGRLIST